MPVRRHPSNPIITPQDINPSRPDFEVICAFNPGVARMGEEIILLVRVAEVPRNENPYTVLVPIYDSASGQTIIKAFDRRDSSIDFSDSRFVRTPGRQYLTSISHLRLARSRDGVNFEMGDAPCMSPAGIYEEYGIEDARITQIGDTCFINYCGTSDLGICTLLASTKDFVSFERHGVMFGPDNKDVEVFPEKVHGKYYALHRPTSAEYKHRNIWIAEGTDLLCWGNHRQFMSPREGLWDNGRVGGSAIPFRVEGGWLEIYHGASKSHRYCLGAVLMDADEPWRIVARSREPFLEPEAPYEVEGFFGNVVFNNGVLVEDGVAKIYYGAADTSIAYAEMPIGEILDGLDPV
jgi:predicted GH43/DUF377 family glycosyl hydrolase